MNIRFSPSPKILRFTTGKLIAHKGENKVLKLAPRGLPGERGEQGEPGSAFYLHTQSVAANIWTINHNLGFRPSVRILNSGGGEIEGDVLHTTINQTIIYFTTAIIGTARLN